MKRNSKSWYGEEKLTYKKIEFLAFNAMFMHCFIVTIVLTIFYSIILVLYMYIGKKEPNCALKLSAHKITKKN